MTPSNDLILRALRRQPVNRRPVWMMRQAGRYLPEYLALRKQQPDFMAFCKTPELTCQAALQPLSRFKLDAAILFSDILTLPEALGQSVTFIEGKGPVLSQPIRSERELNQLATPEHLGDLSYVTDSMALLSSTLKGKLPVIGFSGSPWTLATYMIEGGSSRAFRTTKQMVYQHPTLLHNLLGRLTEITVTYLSAQIKAGADLIMLFDTWGGILAYDAYLDCSLHYLQIIAQRLKAMHPDVPLMMFTKQCAPWLAPIAQTDYDGVGIDSSIPLATAKACIGDQVALQGNIDPFLLFAPIPTIKKATQALLDSFGSDPGLIINLGHGIDRDTPIDHVSALIETVHTHSTTDS